MGKSQQYFVLTVGQLLLLIFSCGKVKNWCCLSRRELVSSVPAVVKN